MKTKLYFALIFIVISSCQTVQEDDIISLIKEKAEEENCPYYHLSEEDEFLVPPGVDKESETYYFFQNNQKYKELHSLLGCEEINDSQGFFDELYSIISDKGYSEISWNGPPDQDIEIYGKDEGDHYSRVLFIEKDDTRFTVILGIGELLKEGN